MLLQSNSPMNITLHIPDSVARELRIPENEVEERLLEELAQDITHGHGEVERRRTDQ